MQKRRKEKKPNRNQEIDTRIKEIKKGGKKGRSQERGNGLFGMYEYTTTLLLHVPAQKKNIQFFFLHKARDLHVTML